MVQKVDEDFAVSMHRVHVLHALAQCAELPDVVQEIETASGRLQSEGRVVRLEKRVMKRVLELRFDDRWPPRLRKPR